MDSKAGKDAAPRQAEKLTDVGIPAFHQLDHVRFHGVRNISANGIFVSKQRGCLHLRFPSSEKIFEGTDDSCRIPRSDYSGRHVMGDNAARAYDDIRMTARQSEQFRNYLRLLFASRGDKPAKKSAQRPAARRGVAAEYA